MLEVSFDADSHEIVDVHFAHAINYFIDRSLQHSRNYIKSGWHSGPSEHPGVIKHREAIREGESESLDTLGVDKEKSEGSPQIHLPQD